MAQFADLRGEFSQLFHIRLGDVTPPIRDHGLGLQLRVLTESNDDAADYPGSL
jgi:hypothetical protein